MKDCKQRAGAMYYQPAYEEVWLWLCQPFHRRIKGVPADFLQ